VTFSGTRRALRAAAVLAGLLVAASAAAEPAPAAVLRAGTATLTVVRRGPPADVGEPALLEWVARSAAIVAAYYGRFPVDAVEVRVTTVDGAKMMNGRTFGTPRARIDVSLGQHVTAAALLDDWILVHEMIHLALPQLADEQNWLAEGLSTYVEGIARTRALNLSAVELWTEYLRDMPKGLPQPGDAGLDHTHTWARTYWGGALYCLLADVRIRAETHNQRGLEDALRAIERAGGGMGEEWPVARVLATGDRATGTQVLEALYAAMKDRPEAPDLPALWRDLGVSLAPDGVRFDDDARLAAVRRALTAAPARPPGG
jgi:hypothetical protein